MSALAISLTVGACATHSIRENAPETPKGFRFSYQVDRREAIGLVQAFDDGAHTYLQFADRSPYLTVKEPGADSLVPYHVESGFLVLDGIYDRLVLQDDQATALLLNEEAVTALQVKDEPVATPKTLELPSHNPLASIGVPEREQTMTATLRVAQLNREIDALEARIHTLSNALTEAQGSGGDMNLSIRESYAIPRIIVRFDDMSDEAKIGEGVLAALSHAARSANRIYLHGHTDAFVASDAGTDLAIRRAVAVRRLLVAQKVEASRMRLFYRGAGNFLANNSTPEGKAQNRRVEIEFRKW